MDQTEDLLALTFDLSPAMMALSRIADGLVLRVNKQYEHGLGYSSAEVVGHFSSEFNMFVDPLARPEIGRRMTEEGFLNNFEVQLRTKTGSIITVICSIAPIAIGEQKCMLSVFYDISERKKAEEKMHESQLLFEKVFDLSPSMMAISRLEDGRLIKINNSFVRTFGYTREEAIGKTSNELSLTINTEKRSKALKTISDEGKFSDYEMQIRTKSGQILDVIGSAQIVEIDGERCLLSVHFDVTERKLTNKMLSEKIAELDEFSYVASHDLQEPLRKMVAFSELLKEDLGASLPPQAEKDLFYIADAGYRMQALVRDLLDFSRLGRREMMNRACSLDACLDQAIEHLSLTITEKEAIIERSPLPEVFGDQSMLVHVFLNFVGNALKFVQPGAVPHIRVSADQIGTMWEIAIADNGIGIDPRYQAQIFAPFKRLHGKATYEGSGIGLSMCKKIIERHGGSISVNSTPGIGSTFKFSLETIRKP